MNAIKKDAVLFIAEPRTTYDFGWSYPDEVKKSIRLAQEIIKTRTMLGADVAILSSVSPVKSNSAADFNFGHVKSSWYYQSLIEGWRSKDGELIKDENALMGKCFYPEGYVELSKEKGFGNYELLKHDDDTDIVTKVANYVEELSEDYNIKQIFFFYDYGYPNTPIFNENAIREKLQVPITYFIPTKPYCTQVDDVRVSQECNVCAIRSSSKCIEGVIDCFDQYRKNLDTISSQLEIINKPKEKTKIDDKKNM